MCIRDRTRPLPARSWGRWRSVLRARVSPCPLHRLRRTPPARLARPPSRSQLPSARPRLRPAPTPSRRPR
eukprot:207714-Alexandrium_andersonii.AAC.1